MISRDRHGDLYILGLDWHTFVGGLLLLPILTWLYIQWLISIPTPVYEYRLVTPTEAMQLVNNEGWQVSERVRMTDQAVYVYHRTR